MMTRREKILAAYNNGECTTLAEVGLKFGITRQRVEQIVKAKRVSPPLIESRFARVYFIQVGAFVKIGMTSNNVAARLETIRASCPFPAELLLDIPGGPGLEQSFHNEFAHLRHHHEWFHLRDELLTWITTQREANIRQVTELCQTNTTHPARISID